MYEDFTEILVEHTNGMQDVHKFATNSIARISYYNANATPTSATET